MIFNYFIAYDLKLNKKPALIAGFETKIKVIIQLVANSAIFCLEYDSTWFKSEPLQVLTEQLQIKFER